MSADENGRPAAAADWPHLRGGPRGAGRGGPFDRADLAGGAPAAPPRRGARFRGTAPAEFAVWLRRILAGRMADAVRAARRGKRDVTRNRSLDAPESGRWE